MVLIFSSNCHGDKEVRNQVPGPTQFVGMSSSSSGAPRSMASMDSVFTVLHAQPSTCLSLREAEPKPKTALILQIGTQK